MRNKADLRLSLIPSEPQKPPLPYVAGGSGHDLTDRANQVLVVQATIILLRLAQLNWLFKGLAACKTGTCAALAGIPGLLVFGGIF